jgi:hypothetical protein
MNIRFTSSLTADDENLIAPVVLQALATILNLLPIAYMIRIDTSDAQSYQVSGVGAGGVRLGTPRAGRGLDRWRFQSDVT